MKIIARQDDGTETDVTEGVLVALDELASALRSDDRIYLVSDEEDALMTLELAVRPEDQAQLTREILRHRAEAEKWNRHYASAREARERANALRAAEELDALAAGAVSGDRLRQRAAELRGESSR
jgi:hypothetical protein